MSGDKNRKKPGELVLRTVSAVLLAIPALYATWAGGLLFAAMCAIGSALILYEYLGMVAGALTVPFRIAAAIATAATALLWVFGFTGLALGVFAGSVAVLLAWEFAQLKSAWSAAGVAYAALPFVALVADRGLGQDGLILILLVFASVWGADTFAYFSGRTIGGPKLAPSISPKKTWAGFIGGLVGAGVVAYFVVWCFDRQPSTGFWMFVALMAIIGQAGDLLESSLKRHFDIKDSGKIIPGHGGVLDRVDGLITVAVATWILGLFLMKTGDGTAALPTRVLDAILLP